MCDQEYYLVVRRALDDFAAIKAIARGTELPSEELRALREETQRRLDEAHGRGDVIRGGRVLIPATPSCELATPKKPARLKRRDERSSTPGDISRAE